MPTYDYKCPKCEYETELYQTGYLEHDNIFCQYCKLKMKKLPSLPSGIHFKGSGFYETDYKDKK